jgi:hypothetical protein
MRAARLPLLGLSLAGFVAVLAVPLGAAQAQDRYGPDRSTYSYRDSTGLAIRVRPRSWLDAGNVVRPGSNVNPATNPQLIAASQLNLPAYGVGMRDRFGFSSLPDPITNGPFVGARNPFGPVDYSPFEAPLY